MIVCILVYMDEAMIYTSTEDTEYTVTYDQAGYDEGETAHHWSAVTTDGEVISELWAQIDDEVHPDLGEDGVSFEAGQIIQVETDPAYRREGIASQLYQIAYTQLDGQIVHSPEEHRTPEGDSWATAVN